MARVGGSAGTTRGFLSSVNKWTKETEERSLEAFQNGALDFYDELYDNTPKLTGNMANSLIVRNGGENTQTVTGPGLTPNDGTFRSGASQSIAAIMSAKLGDRLSYIYQATYTRRQNYGFTGTDSLGRMYNQAGRFWIERVGGRYRSIMRAAASRLRMKMK